ncbi:MAG: dihydrolipoyl dehydrogenase [Armatimonadota bacterium]|nr:dihydrolipoyl dehydrogenase [Armatimonadota bacterium]MDR7448997.1 dihydrolipoyl dehydrogenase [Armatimonadota bacterium]MDR7479537.1 dihydrolipoyl dehydrogenase [Armatimonadota bacterium]MDR7489063.1 dihydrolipoyl dehydrogenase [Armatimonadota bacterium]MDR7490510.1 dihydrolipoyl dehydrogenase [Armatimonadota bacterium]
MPDPYDLVIVGGGPGGYVGAIRAAQLGLRTALVERDKVGGTCLHYGCIPTKALLRTAELLDALRHPAEMGVRADGVAVDLPAAHARKARVVDKLHKGTQFLMRKHGIDVFHGEARFLTAHDLAVALADGSETSLRAHHVLIATGSAPKSLPHLPIDQERILDSTGVLALQEVPRRLLIVGAGAVGVEFASLFRAFGSEVTLVEVLPTLVPLEDEEIGRALARAFQRRGIAVHTETTVERVERRGAELVATLRRVRTAGAVPAAGPGPSVGGDQGAGSEQGTETVRADYILVAVGRAPVVRELAPEEAGVAVDAAGVVVDEDLRTTVPHIYAIGDVVGTRRPYRLAHVASDEAITVVERIAGHDPAPIDYQTIPRPTFSIPQVATMGLSEREARAAGREVRVGRFAFQANSKAAIEGETEGLVKVVVDAKVGELLGVHMVGPGVTELVAEAVAVRALEGTVLELGTAVHAHPTLAEAVKEAALDAMGRVIHA